MLFYFVIFCVFMPHSACLSLRLHSSIPVSHVSITFHIEIYHAFQNETFHTS